MAGPPQTSFQPKHYLKLLERKPGGLDHSRPFENWELPECFLELRRRSKSDRDYIQVLLLLDKYPVERLTKAITKALDYGVYRADAVKQFLFDDPDLRLTSFSLDGREHLKRVNISTTKVSDYDNLLAAGGEA